MGVLPSGKIEDNLYNMCLKCDTKVKITSATSTLRKRLKTEILFLHTIESQARNYNSGGIKMVIPETFEDIKSKFDLYICQWIIDMLPPFSVVEDEYSVKMVTGGNADLIDPSRHTIRRRILVLEGYFLVKFQTSLNKSP